MDQALRWRRRMFRSMNRAYTGETSAAMLRDFGVRYVLVGAIPSA